MKCIAAYLLFTLVSLGCRPGDGPSVEPLAIGKAETPIYGVYEGTKGDDASSLTTTSIAGTVVSLWGTSSGETAHCSGVLIARDLVLSAAHCYPAFGRILVNEFMSWVKHYEIYPAWIETEWLEDSRYNQFDVALVRLETPVPETNVKNIAPVFLGRHKACAPTGAIAPKSSPRRWMGDELPPPCGL